MTELPADAWAALLPTVRHALHDVDDAVATPALRRLRAAPTGRLAGGRVRREVCALIAEGGPLWEALRERLQDAELARTWASALEARSVPAEPSSHERSVTAQLQATRRELERARERLRATREERDALRRRLDAAQAELERRDAAAVELARGRQTADEEVARLRDRLAQLEVERERAVARERRRGEAAQTRLREELAELRRREDERRNERRRADERREAQQAEARRLEEERRRNRRARAPRVVPGRPSTLPSGVVPGTAEAVGMLLHAGRLVLVDGYNLTRRHRDHLDLETQRSWLVRLLATAALQRRIRPVAVFDGERASVARPALASREVEVRFTPAGITADDEVVLAVEATDEPVLVVTDDRELQARVSASGADVTGTDAFVSALG
ncbi:NYN domain-containing protein [Egicoccus halophilus]|uniref:NYN domain-containing protein n=1 Tax=Egicoccus halophilus TaxID=1670830 RepID=UPI001030C314|nr:NYN domain-containing protein [Egicoccus halophilus]